MHSDPELTERLRRAADKSPLTERVMFGGVAFFLNSNMCCGIYHQFLILRIGEAQAEIALKNPHARPMDLTGKPMRGWIMIDPQGCATKRQLERWIDKAITFVNSLPPKNKPVSPPKKKK